MASTRRPERNSELRALLPDSFDLVLQSDADFGTVLLQATRHLLKSGHDCSILINSDSPTLPHSFLVHAIEALREPGDRVVLGPATDGGYYLIGLKAAHAELFRDIPWSTADVFRRTIERARDIGLSVVTLPVWYDIDDAATFSVLKRELAGIPPAFAEPGLVGGPAAATRAFISSLEPHDAVPIRLTDAAQAMTAVAAIDAGWAYRNSDPEAGGLAVSASSS